MSAFTLNRTRTALVAASAVAVLTLASACNDGSSSGGSTGSGSDRGADGAKAALIVEDNDDLGKIVTDQDGRTLYRFDKDTADPSASNCVDDCAKKWPPAMVEKDRVRLKGVDKSLVGQIVRKDGSKQLTLNGWPLYRFAKDTKSGETKGQGVMGTWFVSTPDGKKAQSADGGGGGEKKDGDSYDY
jgi:predicted lipoprotein with Yx(FWY)xxD motif